MALTSGYWPDWVQMVAYPRECITKVRVTHGAFEHRFEISHLELPEKTLREVVWKFKQDLIRQQTALDKVTQRLKE